MTLILFLSLCVCVNIALLSGTLRMYQKIGCDLEYMTLRCPTGTSISVQSATFGKNPVLPGLCQQQSSSIGSSKGHQGFSNNVTSSSSSSSSTTCQLPPEIQVSIYIHTHILFPRVSRVYSPLYTHYSLYTLQVMTMMTPSFNSQTPK